MTLRDRIATLFGRPRADSSIAALNPGGGGFGAGYDQPGIGLGCLAERVRTASFSPGRSLSYYEIDALMRYSAVARKICTAQAEDAVRGGVQIRGADQSTQEAVSGELDRIDWWEHVVRGRSLARAHGGAVTLIEIDDGRAWHEPVDYGSIQRIGRLLTIDREDVSAIEWPRVSESEIPIGVEPKILHCQIRVGPYTRTVPVHRQRCVIWHGLPASQRDTSGVDDHWWGTSVLDLVNASLTRWGAAHQLAAETLASLTQEVLTSPAVRDMIRQQGGPQALAGRARALKYGMSALSMLVLDESETYAIQSRGASGFAEIMEALRAELVTATDIPRLRLYGEQPGGLGQIAMPGELRLWYDKVETERPSLIGGPTRYVCRLIGKAADTPAARLGVGPIVLEWPSLVTPTDDERLAARKAAAEARKLDIDAGIITEDEARHDPDVIEHYPEIDIEEPAPGKPESTSLFGDSPAEPEQPIPVVDVAADERLISLPEAGAMLGVGKGTIAGLARSGQVRVAKIGGRLRAVESDVLEIKRASLERRAE